MKWNNAFIDKPPQNGQTILISVSGVYYISVYDSKNNLYNLADQPETFFDPKQVLIYWTEFTNPNEEKKS